MLRQEVSLQMLKNLVAGNPARIIRFREESVIKENKIISIDDAIINKGNYQTKKVIKK